MEKSKIALGFAIVFIFSLVVFSQEKVKELEDRLPRTSGKERLEILLRLTKVYKKKDWTKALAHGKEALELMESTSDSRGLIKHLDDLCLIAYRHGDYNAVLEYANRILESAYKMGDIQEYARALLYLGKANKFLANYDVAIDAIARAQTFYEQLGQSEKVAECLHAIGLIYRRLNHYNKALEFILKAGEIYDKLGDKKKLSIIFNNSGIIHDAMGNLNTALENYKKALKIDEELNDLRGIAIVQKNIALIYSQQGKTREALELLNEVLAREEKLGEKQNISITLLNIGLCYKSLKNFPRALSYLKRAKKMKEEIHESYGIAEVLVRLGALYREWGDHGKALPYLEKGLALAVKIQAPIYICDANRELSTLFEDLKDYPRALEYHKKFKAMNDTLFSEKNSQRIAELQSRFDIERKEQEISLLRKDTQIQQLDLKRQKNLKNMMILVSILVMILAFVILARYRLKVKAAQAISESEDKFRTLAEQSVLGIYIIQDNIIQYVNPRFLAIFGYGVEEVIQRSPSMLALEEDRLFLADRLAQRKVGGTDSNSYQFRGVTKKGEMIFLESYGAPIYYQGQPAVLETIIDITGRKRTEEELARYREHLADLVEDRTRELKEVQAELVRKERLSVLGQLTATVAHEIRNPLGTVRSTIFSMGKTLEKSDLSRTQRALQLAERNIVRCDKIIDDLLNFTLLRQLKPEATPIDSWLDALLKEQTLPERIHCVRELNAGIEVSIDRERFRRAVINVLDNAVSALLDPQAPGNRLTVGSLVTDHRLEIRVSDTGAGIPVETRKRIFEPLFTTKSFGFGLGLPVVKNIMQEHGGGVEILSRERQGTTVLLWLPL